ncbi:bleomycin hydrolase, partial [Coemansia sp. RSA 2531]
MHSIARNIRQLSVVHGRQLSTTRTLARDAIKNGLVVGMFASHKLFNSEQIPQAVQDKILQEAQAQGNKADAGSVQLVLSPDLTQHIAVVGLGNESTNMSEIVRTAVANGVKQLKAKKISNINIAPMPCAHASGEAATLASYSFTAFKTQKTEEQLPTISSTDAEEWNTGRVYAEAQNFARELMATPANFMTPTIFARRVQDELAFLPNTKVNVYDEQWARDQRMGGLIAVSQGSDEPLRFVEIVYQGHPGPVSLALV